MDALISQIRAVTDPAQLPPLWAQALSLEEQSLPYIQQSIDAVQTVPDPSELLKKKIIILEVRVEILIIEICVAKRIILQLQEEYGVPQVPPEPIIPDIVALSGQMEALEEQGDSLVSKI